MVSYVDGLFAIAAAELSNIRDRGGIERPECVLVEGFYALVQANFNAVRQQIILSQEVLLLDLCE